MPLTATQSDFVALLHRRGALRFGEFTLKSGRASPYFINTGCLHEGGDIERLGQAYAATIQACFGNDVAVIFGPAYKGIPLALAAALGYERLVGRPVGWAYDRKEAKDHGDGGSFVGALLKPGTSVVIVDDVLTAGTALRESIAKLAPTGVTLLGAIVSVDRQERGLSDRPAIAELSEQCGLPVTAIVTIVEAVEHLVASGKLPVEQAQRVQAHVAQAR